MVCLNSEILKDVVVEVNVVDLKVPSTNSCDGLRIPPARHSQRRAVIDSLGDCFQRMETSCSSWNLVQIKPGFRRVLTIGDKDGDLR